MKCFVTKEKFNKVNSTSLTSYLCDLQLRFFLIANKIDIIPTGWAVVRSSGDTQKPIKTPAWSLEGGPRSGRGPGCVVVQTSPSNMWHAVVTLYSKNRDGPFSFGPEQIGGMKLGPDVPVKTERFGYVRLSAYSGWPSLLFPHLSSGQGKSNMWM